MVKKFLILVFLISFLAIVNCSCVKIGTYTHERVDLGTRGNRGYLLGSSPSTTSVSEKPARKVLQLEITLPGPKEESVVSSETRETKQKKGVSQPPYQPEAKPKKSRPKIK